MPIQLECNECGDELDYCDQCNAEVKDWQRQNIICFDAGSLHFCCQDCANEYNDVVVTFINETKVEAEEEEDPHDW